MRLSKALLLFAFVFATPFASVAALQQSGVTGVVYDSLGNVLEAVQVELVGTPYHSITDGKGQFKLLGIVPGNYTLSMRRLGYAPFTMNYEIGNGTATTVDFELTQSAVRLASLNTKSEYVSAKLRRVGFENRMKTAGVSSSHFITRQEIEKRNVQSLTHIIDKLGSRARSCDYPNVFLDGVAYNTLMDTQAMQPTGGISLWSGATLPAPSATSNSHSPDESAFQKIKPLETFQIRNIEGMEVYTSAAETPAEFKDGPNGRMNNKCTVLLWTRER